MMIEEVKGGFFWAAWRGRGSKKPRHILVLAARCSRERCELRQRHLTLSSHNKTEKKTGFAESHGSSFISVVAGILACMLDQLKDCYECVSFQALAVTNRLYLTAIYNCRIITDYFQQRTWLCCRVRKYVVICRHMTIIRKMRWHAVSSQVSSFIKQHQVPQSVHEVEPLL